MHLGVPFIGSVYVFVCRKLSPHLSLRAGSQVFALLMLFLYVILHTMWSGKSLQLLCILPFGMLCLSAINMMFVKIMLAVCMTMTMTMTKFILKFKTSLRYIRDTSMYKYNNNYSKNK